MKTRLALSLVFTASLALAGSRAPYGGSLKLVATERPADTLGITTSPVAVALASLSRTPLCAAVDTTLTPTGNTRLAPRPPVTVAQVLEAVTPLRNSGTPYEHLLELAKSPLVVPGAVELDTPLKGADLQAALCHPALGLSRGPFVRSGQSLTARPETPEGRPYLDSISLSQADARGADRQLAARKAQVSLGATSSEPGPMLFAAYAVRNLALPEVVQTAINAALDKGDLTRFFIQPPAEPLYAALPGLPAPPPAVKPVPAATVREIRLVFESTNLEHQSVAERLQVKLQPLGLRVVMQPLALPELQARLLSGDFDLSLQTVLLSPSARVSTTILNDLTHRPRSDAPPGNLIPLYVKGVGLSAAPEVRNLHRSMYGLPQLDDVFLSAD